MTLKGVLAGVDVDVGVDEEGFVGALDRVGISTNL